MLHPSINDLKEKADSRYTIVNLAAKRARDIIDGMPILTEAEAQKPVSIAANEIAEELITYRREETPCSDSVQDQFPEEESEDQV